MARPLRIEYPGAVYHVTGRGNARQDVFLCDEDRLGFLAILEQVNRRYNWICHAYCLMDNHYHLVIETPDGNLSRGMRQLGGVYTQAFNRRHERVGHLFQGRFKAILVQKQSHLLETVRYVVLNPVRAEIVSSIDDWPWSSFHATMGATGPHPCLTVDWVQRQFSEDLTKARLGYRRFVADGIGQDSLWKHLKGQTLLGRDDFAGRFQTLLQGVDPCEIPRSERFVNRPSLQALFADTAVADLPVRNQLIVRATEEFGYTQKEVSECLGLHYSTISRLIKAATSKVKT
jgi:putative transposase